MDVEAVIVDFAALAYCRVYLRGEHSGLKGCVMESSDYEGALVIVRWGMGLSLAV
jgi:hypothetical protein